MQVRSNSSPGSSRVGRQAGPSFGKGVQIKFKLVKTVGSSFIQSFFFDLTWNKFVPSCKSKQGWGSELQSLFFCCWAQNKVDSCDGNLKASRHDASGFGYSVESPSQAPIQAPSLSCACSPCFEEAVGLSSWNHRWIRSRRPSGKRDWWWCQFATCFNKFQANCFLQALPIDFFYQLCRLLQIFKDLMLHFFLGRPPFPMPESFADLGPVPEFTAAPRKKSSWFGFKPPGTKVFSTSFLSTRGGGPLPCWKGVLKSLARIMSRPRFAHCQQVATVE